MKNLPTDVRVPNQQHASARQFVAFIRKEFAHVLRDRKTLLILFGLPVVQIIIFGFALTNEVKNSRILIVDNARDEVSSKVIEKIDASRYFELVKKPMTHRQIEESFKSGTAKLALVIPAGFGRDLIHQGHAPLQVIADASDPNTANALTNYLANIIADYQQQSLSNSAGSRITTQVR